MHSSRKSVLPPTKLSDDPIAIHGIQPQTSNKNNNSLFIILRFTINVNKIGAAKQPPLTNTKTKLDLTKFYKGTFTSPYMIALSMQR